MKSPQAAAWQPHFVLDIATARGKAFEEITTLFEKWAKEHPLPKFDLVDGWLTVTPEVAEQILMRNVKGANRKASLPTVVYYARQMQRNDWPRTGQPLIFNDEGELVDGQHRLWAAYLSGATFETYVVTNVPKHDRLFAYIDNGKSRTAASALQTAGMNGVSPLLVKVLDAAYAYENGLYTVNSVQRRDRMSPVQYLDSLEAHPTARDSAKLAVSEFMEASNLAERENVAFATMILNDLHGDDVTEQFMYQLGGNEETPEGGVIETLRQIYQADANKVKDQMKKHQKLGYLILAFNLWVQGVEAPKKGFKSKLKLAVSDRFPRFVGPSEDLVDEAA